MCHITDIFLGYLVEIINSGASFDAIWPAFELQDDLPLDLVSNGTCSSFSVSYSHRILGTILQAIHALCFLAKRDKPEHVNFWNLFWRVLRDVINGVDYMASPNHLPFTDALDTVKNVLDSPMPKKEYLLQTGFKSFVDVFAYQAECDHDWVRSPHGSATVSAIATHEVWDQIRRVVERLPPNPDVVGAQDCIRTLDRVKRKVVVDSVQAV